MPRVEAIASEVRSTGPSRAGHERLRDGARPPVLEAAIALAACAAGLGASLPFGSGSDSLGGFDVLVVLSVLALLRGSTVTIPRHATATWALVFSLLGLAIMMPFSPHWVVRSAGLVVVVQVLRLHRPIAAPMVYGFLAGALGQVLIGLGGYARAGTITEGPAAFEDLENYRSGFDWLAGPATNPPLSASGLMRLQALAAHPNELALAFAIGALLSLHYVPNKAIRLSVFAALSLGTMLTLSRLAVIALVIGVLLRPAGRTGVPGRLAAVAAAVSAVMLSLNTAVRDRLFDLGDQENAQGRSAGPLDLLDDATILPDASLAVRHNSIAFMLDHGGLLLGGCWVALFIVALVRITARTWTRRFGGTWVALTLLFLTEDRIQSPSFLTVVAVTSAVGFELRRRSDPVPRPQPGPVGDRTPSEATLQEAQ